MSNQHVRVVATREAAHNAITQAYSVARALIQDGKRVKISVGEDDDPVTVKQRRFLHGPVLEQISEQVRVGGERFVTDVWKEYLRKRILGDRWESYKAPGAKRATPHRIRNSTEELGVKAYSEYIDKVIALACTEWHVEFHFDPQERESVRHHERKKKPHVEQ